MGSTHTKVDYTANVQERAGNMVMVVVKETTSTPVSGRGKEWRNATTVRETMIIPLVECSDLMSELSEALYYAAKDPKELDRFESERCYLADFDGNRYGDFYTVAEAEEEARRLFRATARPTSKLALAIRWIENDNPVETLYSTDETMQ